jgi:hypothetical protein
VSGAVDPVILARVREAQAAIRRSLSVAEELLRDEGLPLSIVAGSAVLADFDLGDGVRRRAVSASILVPYPTVDRVIRRFRRGGFSLGQPVDELEIMRGASGRRVLYSLIEPDHDAPVASLRLPTAHPGSEEGRRQRAAFMRAIMGKQVVATLSRVRRAIEPPDCANGRSYEVEVAESDEFRVVPYADEA